MDSMKDLIKNTYRTNIDKLEYDFNQAMENEKFIL